MGKTKERKRSKEKECRVTEKNIGVSHASLSFHYKRINAPFLSQGP